MKGTIKQRSEGSWTLRYDVPLGPDGKRRQKTQTIRGTKKDAERELRRILREIDTGCHVEPSRMNVGQYLDHWLTDYAKPGVSGKTYERYAQIVEGALKPAFGGVPLEKLTALQIQGFYSRALESGRKDGKGGLSPTTVLQYHRILRKALQQGVKWQLLGRNVADAAEPPRAARPEMEALTLEQTVQLLEAAAGTQYHLPILLAATTGLRRGELLALKWEDIDLHTGLVRVRRSLEVTREGITFKPPKTASSKRSVTLPSVAIEAVKRHKAKQAQERLLLGAAYENHGMIMARPDGTVMNPDHLSWGYAHWIKRRPDLPQVRFHDLRHTYATALFKQGEHPKLVAALLGHSSVRTTMDVYSHVQPGMQGDAANRLDAAFRSAMQVEDRVA